MRRASESWQRCYGDLDAGVGSPRGLGADLARSVGRMQVLKLMFVDLGNAHDVPARRRSEWAKHTDRHATARSLEEPRRRVGWTPQPAAFARRPIPVLLIFVPESTIRSPRASMGTALIHMRGLVRSLLLPCEFRWTRLHAGFVNDLTRDGSDAGCSAVDGAEHRGI